MDLCGSSADSWFHHERTQHSTDNDPTFNDSGLDHPWNFNQPTQETKKWSLQFLETLQQFSRMYQPIHGHICVVLCVFGLLTNILNFIVLTRPSMRTSINVVLAAVALCDAGTMCSYLIYVTHFYIVNRGVCLTEIYTYNWMVFILFHSLWSILLHSSSIWLSVLLAFMRLTVMRKAKLSHSFLKPRLVWRPMSYIYAPLAALCIPVIFTHSVVKIDLEPCGNGPVINDTVNLVALTIGAGADVEVQSPTAAGYTVFPSQAALANNCLLLRAVLLINGLCFKLLPCVLLVISIWLLLRTLDAARKRNTRVLRRRTEAATTRNGNGNGNGHAKHFSSRTTKMLLMILWIFLVTELPQAFIATMSGFYPNDVYFQIYPTVGDVLDLLSLLNSGVNFVLYCGMSSRFRSTFIDLFAPTFFRRSLRCSRSRFSISDIDSPTTANASGVRTGLVGWSMFMSLAPNTRTNRRALSMNESRFYSSFDAANPSSAARRRRQCSLSAEIRIKSGERSLDASLATDVGKSVIVSEQFAVSIF